MCTCHDRLVNDLFILSENNSNLILDFKTDMFDKNRLSRCMLILSTVFSVPGKSIKMNHKRTRGMYFFRCTLGKPNFPFVDSNYSFAKRTKHAIRRRNMHQQASSCRDISSRPNNSSFVCFRIQGKANDGF